MAVARSPSRLDPFGDNDWHDLKDGLAPDAGLGGAGPLATLSEWLSALQSSGAVGPLPQGLGALGELFAAIQQILSGQSVGGQVGSPTDDHGKGSAGGSQDEQQGRGDDGDDDGGDDDPNEAIDDHDKGSGDGRGGEHPTRRTDNDGKGSVGGAQDEQQGRGDDGNGDDDSGDDQPTSPIDDHGKGSGCGSPDEHHGRGDHDDGNGDDGDDDDDDDGNDDDGNDDGGHDQPTSPTDDHGKGSEGVSQDEQQGRGDDDGNGDDGDDDGGDDQPTSPTDDHGKPSGGSPGQGQPTSPTDDHGKGSWGDSQNEQQNEHVWNEGADTFVWSDGFGRGKGDDHEAVDEDHRADMNVTSEVAPIGDGALEVHADSHEPTDNIIVSKAMADHWLL